MLVGGLAGGAILAIGVLLLAMNGSFEPPKQSSRNVATPKGSSATPRVAPEKSAGSNRGDSTAATSGASRSPRERSASASDNAKRVSPSSVADDSDSASDADTDATSDSTGDSEMPAAPSDASPADRALANAFISADRSPDSSPEKSKMGGAPGDYPTNSAAAPSSGNASATDEPELSAAEKKRQDQIAKLKRLIARQFNVFRRSTDRKKGDPADYFVVAKYEMPLSTRMADITFEISNHVDPSVTRVADYLLETPSGSLRDFQVVGRFESAEEADAGIAKMREQYDRAKEYQQQLLAFLQQQQRFQATSIRRC